MHLHFSPHLIILAELNTAIYTILLSTFDDSFKLRVLQRDILFYKLNILGTVCIQNQIGCP